MERNVSAGLVVVMAAAAVLVTGLVAPVVGQNKGATLTGRVTLADGSRLPGIRVSVGDRTAITNENGEFRFLFLPPGKHKARFEVEGFQTVERGIDLEAGRNKKLDVQMETTTLREEVTVPGNSPVVDVRVTAFQRRRDDGSTSLGIGLDGAAVDSFTVGLPRKIRGELEPGWISPDWTYDADSGTASGPPLDGFRLRLDAARQLGLPDRLKLEAKFGGQTVFSGKAQVGARGKIDLSAVPYLGLPEVITPGRAVTLTMPQNLDAVLELDYGDLGTYGLSALPTAAPGLPEGFPGEGRMAVVGAVPFGDLPGLIGVRAVDNWGETLFLYEWDPVVVQAGHGASRPLITAASELNFAGQQLCVCGSFADPGPLGNLQIGGRPLGPPSGFSPHVANFTTPGDLAPGPYELGWRAGAGGDGGPFQTEVIEIHARINDEVIQKGGTTGLEIEIVGTDRKLPVELVNRSPDKISMAPSDTIQTDSIGGPGRNHVPGVRVTGRKPGTYSIDWTVGAGECPCADTLPEIEEAWMEVADEMVAQLVAEHQRPAVILDSNADVQTIAEHQRPAVILDPDADVQTIAEHQRPAVILDSDDSQGGGCDAPLVGDRFSLDVTWPEAGVPADCRWLEPDGLLFFWTGSTGEEILVKVLDNCELNDHYWVFAAGLTDVEVELTVTDTQAGEVRRHDLSLGGPAPVIGDWRAFQTCP